MRFGAKRPIKSFLWRNNPSLCDQPFTYYYIIPHCFQSRHFFNYKSFQYEKTFQEEFSWKANFNRFLENDEAHWSEKEISNETLPDYKMKTSDVLWENLFHLLVPI